MEIDISKFKDLFLSEFDEHLQMLEGNLMKFEKDTLNKTILDELIRSSHTIKGSAATMRFTQTAFLTHVLEDVFDYARNDLITITPEIVNQLFLAVDYLKKSRKTIQTSDKEEDLTEICAKIKEITGVKTEGVGKSIRSADGKPIVEVNSQIVTNEIKKEVAKKIESNIEEIEQIKLEKISHIKVPIKRLDELMSLMEELLIDKMKLENLSSEISDENLSGIINHLSRLVSNIQYQVMQTRLISLDQIFLPFPRMIRDLAQKYKKEIDLDIQGGDLELDRTIIDQLSEPLLHLLRNAVDHGISTKGTIKIEAVREREFALIKIEDNGEGVDWTKVIEAGVKKNLVNPVERENLLDMVNDYQQRLNDVCKNKKDGYIDQDDVYLNPKVVDLLFTGRLSTNEVVTETSGRGVGLSIVKQFTQQMNGTLIVESPISIQSQSDQKVANGTRFTLVLPLSLAIIRALIVEIKGEIFAIPFSSIDRSVFLDSDNLKSIADQQMAVVDDVSIPITNLENVLKLKRKANSEPVNIVPSEVILEKPDKNKTIVVLIKRGRDTIGIVVDKLMKEQEIIVKPMPKVLRGITGFSGSTTLGNGETILILDAVSLLKDIKFLLNK